MCEKELYGGMLKQIYLLGHNVGWQPELLQKIKPLIDSTREQLAHKSNQRSNPGQEKR
jgi:hypothetical protein